jgi:hypothetical protein
VVRVADLVELDERQLRVVGERRDGRRERLAHPAAVRREDRERELGAGTRVERAGEAAVAAERRALAGDLERGLRSDGEAQHPHLACEGDDREAERRDRDERDAETDRQPGVRRRVVAGDERQGGERGGEQPRAGHRDAADLRPGAEAPARRAGAPGPDGAPQDRRRRAQERGGRERRGVEPGGDAGREPELDRDEGPERRARHAGAQQAAERVAALGGPPQLGERSGHEDRRQEAAQHDVEHPAEASGSRSPSFFLPCLPSGSPWATAGYPVPGGSSSGTDE